MYIIAYRYVYKQAIFKYWFLIFFLRPCDIVHFKAAFPTFEQK